MEDVNYLMKHSSFQKEVHSLIVSEFCQETTRGQIKAMQAL